MVKVSVTEAKARMSQLIELVLSGEVVVVTRRGQPVIRLVPIDLPS